MVNAVFLMGNLTGPPDLKYTATGTPVCNMRMAVNQFYKTASGEKKEQTLFIDVVAWSRQAENCAEYLEKGSKILVQGSLASREWDDREGRHRITISVNARLVQFLTQKKAGPQPQEHDEGTREEVPF